MALFGEMMDETGNLRSQIARMEKQREELLGRLANATKLIEEGNLNLAILIDHETALHRIKSLDEKNVPKYAQQIASEALLRHRP